MSKRNGTVLRIIAREGRVQFVSVLKEEVSIPEDPATGDEVFAEIRLADPLDAADVGELLANLAGVVRSGLSE